MFKIILLAIFFTSLVIAAVPKTNQNHRVIDNEKSIHEKHIHDEKHDTKYDHEAFLGKDEAEIFDELTPEESKRRLGLIVDRIDENKDGFIDLAELKNWIHYTQKRYSDDVVNREWNKYNPNHNDTLSWESYHKLVYGFLDGIDFNNIEIDSEFIFYKKLLSRDRRRWSIADRDGDDNLNKTEFKEFLHPEQTPRMYDLVVIETIEDIDKNNDGKVSEDEYINDLYKKDEDDDVEPEWVTSERETFKIFRDKDGDGFMNKEEVKEWILPNEFDNAEAEARHLIYEADTDGDEKLTKLDVLEKYDLFVGSQATDFGEALTRHDEF